MSSSTHLISSMAKKTTSIFLAITLGVGFVPSRAFAAVADQAATVDNAYTQAIQQVQHDEIEKQAQQKQQDEKEKQEKQDQQDEKEKQEQQEQQDQQNQQNDQVAPSNPEPESIPSDSAVEFAGSEQKEFDNPYASGRFEEDTFVVTLKQDATLRDIFGSVESDSVGRLIKGSERYELNGHVLKNDYCMESTCYMFKLTAGCKFSVNGNSPQSCISAYGPQPNRRVLLADASVAGAEASFSNVTLADCSATNVEKGGAMELYAGNVELHDVAIRNCYGCGKGGILYVGGNARVAMDGNTTVQACNSALAGGCVYVDGGTFVMNGGALGVGKETQNGGAVYVNAGIFKMNSGSIQPGVSEASEPSTEATGSMEKGGAVYVAKGGSFSIEGGQIQKCNAKQGGAIYCEGTGQMWGYTTTIKNCSANYGGGIYAASGCRFHIVSGNVEGCKASKEGGSFWAGGPAEGVNAAECGIGNATIKGGSEPLRGGNIYNAGNMTVVGSKIKNGIASDRGGNIYSCGSLRLSSESEVLDGICGRGAGIGNYGGNVELDSVTIKGNHSCLVDSRCGAGLDTKDGTVTIKGSTLITENSCGQGGGISADNSMIHLQSGSISKNVGYDANGIYLSGESTFIMDGGEISNNTTGYPLEIEKSKYIYGGGVYVRNNCVFEMHGGTISGNEIVDLSYSKVRAAGGGICVRDTGKFIMTGGSIVKNKAGVDGDLGQGGGVFCDMDSTVEISGGTVDGNSASMRGGGVFCDGAKLRIANSSISGNKVNGVYLDYYGDDYGGGLYVEGSQVTVDNTEINNNYACDGAGVYMTGGAKISMNGKSVSGNKSSGGPGAGIYVPGKCTLVLKNTSVSNNKTTSQYGTEVYRGGGIYNDGTIDLKDVTVSGNLSQGYGGGIYSSGSATLADCSVVNNSTKCSSHYAGGIYIERGPFKISGVMVVKGNKLDGGCPSDLKVGAQRYLTIQGSLSKGSCIGIDETIFKGGSYAVTGKNNADYSEYFFCNNEHDGISNSSKNEIEVRWAHSVKFDVNGGTGKTCTEKLGPGMHKLPEPSKFGFTPPPHKKFGGWEVGESVLQPGEYYNVKGNMTIKAHWVPRATYNVSFDANGGMGWMPSASVGEGESYKLPECGFFTLDGSEFDSWDVAGVQHKPGDEIAVLGDMTVKAVWHKQPTPVQVSITFEPDNHIDPAKTEYAQMYADYKLPECSFTAPAGKKFSGWSIGNAIYKSGDVVQLTAPVTVYAQWTPISYTVRFDTNGATSGSAPADVNAYYDDDVAIPAKGDLAREGFTFCGWNTQPDGQGETYVDGSMVERANLCSEQGGVVTLYAKWGKCYPVLEGDGFVHAVGSGEAASVRIDAPFEDFQHVIVDGKTLVEGVDYSKEPGSTVITFAPAFLDSLEVGAHEARYMFTSGYAESTINITGNSVEPVDGNSESGGGSGGGFAKSGDATNVIPLLVLLGMSGAAVIGIVISRKKTSRM